MSKRRPERVAGEALNDEIERIESLVYDEQVSKTIAARLARADDPQTTFISHDAVVAASHARLVAKLKHKGHA